MLVSHSIYFTTSPYKTLYFLSIHKIRLVKSFIQFHLSKIYHYQVSHIQLL
jgi:hypothetical protein